MIRAIAVRSLVAPVKKMYVNSDSLVVAGSVGCPLVSQLSAALNELVGAEKVMFVADGATGDLLCAMGRELADIRRSNLLAQWSSARWGLLSSV